MKSKTWTWLTLFSALFIAALLRFLYLGSPFESSDNAEVAVKITTFPGYAWIIKQSHSAFIFFYVKIFAGLISLLHVRITEFWWKAPIALAGVCQIPLTYFFLKRLGYRKIGSVSAAAFIAVLPIHVFQSRFSYGYEVLGVTFVTIAIWALVDFFEHPTKITGLKASFFTGLYLISHVYIVPFIFCLASIAVIFGPKYNSNIFHGACAAAADAARKLVWVFPVLFFPFYYHAIAHTLEKSSRLGCYLPHHIGGFVGNIGLFLTLLLVISIIMGAVYKDLRSKYTLLFTASGLCYLLPLFFGAPPGITVIRGFMLMGIYFWVLCLACVLDRFSVKHQKLVIIFIAACYLITLCGTAQAIFGNNKSPGINRIEIERGGIYDPGSKAAGYLIRKYVPSSARLAALHRAVEPENLIYYFGRKKYAFHDLSSDEMNAKLDEIKDSSDVIICEDAQAPRLDADMDFRKIFCIIPENMDTRMLVYARVNINILPRDINRSQRRALNHAYDAEYSPKINLLWGIKRDVKFLTMLFKKDTAIKILRKYIS